MFGICLLIFIGLCIYHACEKELPADYHNNWRLEAHDSQLVREGKMTQRQFEKNMNNGKYRQESDKMLEILFIVVLIILFNIPKWKFDNYTPPTGQKIDYNAQALDRVRNNLTNEQVMRNTVNGKYNVKRQIWKPSENNLVAFVIDKTGRM